MLPKINDAIADIRDGLKNRSRTEDANAPSELKLRHILLIHQRNLIELRRRLVSAKTELGALMNLPSGTRFKLKGLSLQSMRVPRLRVDIGDLEHLALENRTELREEDYQKRISILEVRAAYLRLLPGIELKLAGSYDSNSFLYANTWGNAAVAVTSNLMRLATQPLAIKYAEKMVGVADARRLASSMAVIAQVHLALESYALASEVLTTAQDLSATDIKINDAAEKVENVNEKFEALINKIGSEAQLYLAYVEAQNALGRILSSVGVQRFPPDIEKYSVGQLAEYLHKHLDDPQLPTNTREQTN